PQMFFSRREYLHSNFSSLPFASPNFSKLTLLMLPCNLMVLAIFFRTSSDEPFIPGNRIAAINMMRSSWHLGAEATTSTVLLPVFAVWPGCIFFSGSLLDWPQTRHPHLCIL
ncbi:hypothetical protein STEG23_000341, partial [Scotinomys teguina]